MHHFTPKQFPHLHNNTVVHTYTIYVSYMIYTHRLTVYCLIRPKIDSDIYATLLLQLCEPVRVDNDLSTYCAGTIVSIATNQITDLSFKPQANSICSTISIVKV